MDLDHLLVWTVGLSVLLAGGTLLTRHGLQYRGWLAVSVSILGILGAGLLLWPERAGRIAALPWAVLFLAPGLGARLLAALMARRALGAATLLTRVLAVLHPFDGWREQPQYLEALVALQSGRVDEARRRLEGLARHEGPIGWDARAHLHRLDGTWAKLVDWIAAHPRRDALLADPSMILAWLRGLGEIGDLPGLIDAYADRVFAGRAGVDLAVRPVGGLFLAAFAGRPDAIDALLENGCLSGFSPELVRFWRATALQTGGDPAGARALLEELVATPDATIHLAARRRIAEPRPPAAPLEAAQQAKLDALLAKAIDGGTSLARPPRRAPAQVTYALITLIAGVYVLQIPGGTTDIENLVRMGALILPAELMDGQWWRLLTANLLHFGFLHLLVNLAALWYFGRHLEQALGRLRYGVLFVLSGPAALALVVVLAPLSGSEPRIVVGASAAVMAVVGATGVHLLRAFLKERTAALRRDLIGLGIVLLAQVAFDLSTPQVGFTGHAAGLFCGVVLGWLLLASRAPALDAARPRSR